jgi:acid phosphatase
VIVMMENHSYGEVIGNPAAPFLNRLARGGALFTNSHAVTHPSEPNYLALFSGGTQGIAGDDCPVRLSAPNLATQLLAAGHTFAGYAEGLPGTGSLACYAGEYARKHVPWADFANVPAADSKPMTAFPAGDFGRLPTVSFVVPDLCHDMHDCPVAAGDAWLKARIGPYAAWATTHDSLLIVDFDENDGSPGNQIPTIFAGPMVKPGRYGQLITHYSVLRTIEKLYGLRPLGGARSAGPVTGVWR